MGAKYIFALGLALFSFLVALPAQAVVSAHVCSAALSPHLQDVDRSRFYTIAEVTPLPRVLPAEAKGVKIVSAVEVKNLFAGLTTPRTQLKAALDYLKGIQPPSQLARAINFEEFSKEIMKRSQNDWQAFRAFGSDGSIVYAGLAGHSLVITLTGEIYTGMIEAASLTNDARWIPNYNDLDKRF